MTASKSNYLRSKMYQAAVKNTAFTGPATLYASLHTASPGQTGANEVTGNGYARVPVTFGTDTNGAGSSSSAVTFTGPTPANWGTVTHMGIWDALTAGNNLYGDALTNPVATSVGVNVVLPSGAISLAET